MTREYVLWRWDPNGVPHTCSLDEFSFEDNHHFMRGTPLGATFPKDAYMRMNMDARRDNVLTDYLGNTEDLLVISERLKAFMADRKVLKIEYLPLTILDHKKKAMKEPYFIANILEHVDCLDLQASQVSYSKIRKQSISQIEKLVLDPKRVDVSRDLFQIANLEGMHLVSRDLADAMKEAKFTGISWMNLGDYSPYL